MQLFEQHSALFAQVDCGPLQKVGSVHWPLLPQIPEQHTPPPSREIHHGSTLS
jgi:hypothetical protein